jgi:transcriptional regulator with XRE-family HTH domain
LSKDGSRAQRLEAVPSEAAFGRKIRARRQELGLTLVEVADKSGLGRSFVSEIERDQVSPSIASLLKLCRALGLGLRDLFDERPSALIRWSERRRVDLGGHGFTDYALTPRNAKHMLATWTELAPDASAGDDYYALEADEELIVVIDGALTVRFEGEADIHMETGDALTLDPRRKRLIFNALADKTTTVMMVYVPPPL